MEKNHHLKMYLLLKMEIFYGYISLPEGILVRRFFRVEFGMFGLTWPGLIPRAIDLLPEPASCRMPQVLENPNV